MTAPKKIMPDRETLILIIAAAGLLTLILVRGGTSRINYTLPELPLYEAARFDRIEVSGGGDTKTLRRNSAGVWSLAPEGYRADDTLMNGITAILARFEPVDLVSRKSGYERYGVDDSKGLRIRAYSGETLLRDFTAGKASESGRYSYIRLPGDDNIYSVRQDLQGLFGRNPSEMREKELFPETEGSALRLISGTGTGKSRVYRRDEDNLWRGPGGGEADQEALNDLAARLASLQALRWLSGSPSGKAFRVILRGGEEFRLDIYPPTEEGLYPARSDSVQTPFLLSAFSGDTIMDFFKPAEEEREPLRP